MNSIEREVLLDKVLEKVALVYRLSIFSYEIDSGTVYCLYSDKYTYDETIKRNEWYIDVVWGSEYKNVGMDIYITGLHHKENEMAFQVANSIGLFCKVENYEIDRNNVSVSGLGKVISKDDYLKEF